MSSFRTVEVSNALYEHDGLRFITVKTPHLQGRGDICLFVPKVEESLSNLPIYILLHGVYGSAWVWAWKGGAHHTAKRLMKAGNIRPAIIAMPSDGLWGDGSAYFSHHQKNFDRWIVEDVPLAIRENIQEAGPESQLCIGGLSMGGYGALMLGARFPDTFRAISAHSSITRLDQMPLFVEEPLATYEVEGEIPNVIDAMIQHKARLSALRFDCGVGDILLEANRLLHQQLDQVNIKHVYQEFEGGHEWSYWEKHVERTFHFFDKALFPV